MKKIIAFLMACMMLASFTACAPRIDTDTGSSTESVESSEASSKEEEESSEASDESSEPPQTDDLTLGSTFTFDDFEITIGTEMSFDAVSNQFSDQNGADVVVLPVTVTNLGDETRGLNMFYYKFYGTQGTALSDITAYFDDEIGWAGDMRSGASLSSNFYFLYDGDGDYYIEFDNYSEKVEVKIPVTK